MLWQVEGKEDEVGPLAHASHHPADYGLHPHLAPNNDEVWGDLVCVSLNEMIHEEAEAPLIGWTLSDDQDPPGSLDAQGTCSIQSSPT